VPERLHVYVEGLVQGVGFRYATYMKAHAEGLTGWVRNLSDGRVEAEFEGPRPTLDAMLQWCRQGTIHSNVRHVEAVWSATDETRPSFDIVI